MLIPNEIRIFTVQSFTRVPHVAEHDRNLESGRNIRGFRSRSLHSAAMIQITVEHGFEQIIMQEVTALQFSFARPAYYKTLACTS